MNALEPRTSELEAQAANDWLRDYRLILGTEVVIITTAPSYAVQNGQSLPTSRSYIGTITDATSSVLVIEGAGRRIVVPWHAVVSVEQLNQPPHPGL